MLSLTEDEEVFHIRRLRLIDDEPIGLITSRVPVLRVPELQATDFAETGACQSIYYVLEHVHQVALTHAVEVFDAVNLNDDEARVLKLLPNSAILSRNRVTYNNLGEAIAYERGLYRVRYRISWNGRSISEVDTSALDAMP
jgi:GntR family transcriptional regulator